MAVKKSSGSKKPARKKKVDLKDLSRSSKELSNGQAEAVKAGAGAVVSRRQHGLRVG
jgi:hypothetical protein